MAHRRKVYISVVHPRRIDVEEPLVGSGVVDADVDGRLRCAADAEVLKVDNLSGVGPGAVLI